MTATIDAAVAAQNHIIVIAAPLNGVYQAPPRQVAELVAWCASTDGQAHSAPRVSYVESPHSSSTDNEDTWSFVSDTDRDRFYAMLVDYDTWVTGLMTAANNPTVAPPGLEPRAIFTAGNAANTWAVAWCAAH